jgi:hypothetical protein
MCVDRENGAASVWFLFRNKLHWRSNHVVKAPRTALRHLRWPDDFFLLTKLKKK